MLMMLPFLSFFLFFLFHSSSSSSDLLFYLHISIFTIPQKHKQPKQQTTNNYINQQHTTNKQTNKETNKLIHMRTSLCFLPRPCCYFSSMLIYHVRSLLTHQHHVLNRIHIFFLSLFLFLIIYSPTLQKHSALQMKGRAGG
jgi:hypothetical protein